MPIVVNEDLKAYIDPLTADEHDALERSLLKEGCRDTLVLWGDTLVDGHNRYGICQKHGIPFQTLQSSLFHSVEDVHLWMIDQHLGRRSVSDFQRGVLALRKRILADGSGDGVERANTAYKEWRGARVERLCTDAARRAFHLGVLAGAQGRAVRFYAAPNDAPCDACALDARSGERPAGQSFPSGSAYPPLHAGCACAVVPV